MLGAKRRIRELEERCTCYEAIISNLSKGIHKADPDRIENTLTIVRGSGGGLREITVVDGLVVIDEG